MRGLKVLNQKYKNLQTNFYDFFCRKSQKFEEKIFQIFNEATRSLVSVMQVFPFRQVSRQECHRFLRRLRKFKLLASNQATILRYFNLYNSKNQSLYKGRVRQISRIQ